MDKLRYGLKYIFFYGYLINQIAFIKKTIFFLLDFWVLFVINQMAYIYESVSAHSLMNIGKHHNLVFAVLGADTQSHISSWRDVLKIKLYESGESYLR
jgi:hypothetical protein